MPTYEFPFMISVSGILKVEAKNLKDAWEEAKKTTPQKLSTIAEDPTIEWGCNFGTRLHMWPSYLIHTQDSRVGEAANLFGKLMSQEDMLANAHVQQSQAEILEELQTNFGSVPENPEWVVRKVDAYAAGRAELGYLLYIGNLRSWSPITSWFDEMHGWGAKKVDQESQSDTVH